MVLSGKKSRKVDSLDKTEKTGLYTNPFDGIDEFVALTRSIKEQFLMMNGELMKDLGGLLKEAQRLCGKYHTSFTYYLDRVLAIPKTSAAVMMKTEAMDLDSRKRGLNPQSSILEDNDLPLPTICVRIEGHRRTGTERQARSNPDEQYR